MPIFQNVISPFEYLHLNFNSFCSSCTIPIWQLGQTVPTSNQWYLPWKGNLRYDNNWSKHGESKKLFTCVDIENCAMWCLPLLQTLIYLYCLRVSICYHSIVEKWKVCSACTGVQTFRLAVITCCM